MSGPSGKLRQRLLDIVSELEQGPDADFSMRVTYTYLLGVYLAVNAISDAFLLVEGPDCTHMKTQYIQGNHDWLSTLTTVSGWHRVANTALHPSHMSESRESNLLDRLERMAAHPEVAGLLLTAMPMAAITGADYQRLCRQVSARHNKEVLSVPGLSLSGDWIDGYCQTLKALARGIALRGSPQPRSVAIVGYLYDRNEDDHGANLAVLKEMFARLELELVSVWLSGQSWRELGRVGKAGTIIALPYGRAAARAICRRSGAELLELPVPLGPRACDQWLRVLGERFERQDQAENYRREQLARLAPRLEWLVPFLFQNLPAAYVGDPFLLPGLRDLLQLVGTDLRFAIVTNRRSHFNRVADSLDTLECLVYPRHRRFIHFLLERSLQENVRLLITNNYGAAFPLPGTATVEFGFPSVFHHALYPRPFLGYPGTLALLDRLANSLRAEELAQARTRLLGPAG